jgi:hypothetical protein
LWQVAVGCLRTRPLPTSASRSVEINQCQFADIRIADHSEAQWRQGLDGRIELLQIFQVLEIMASVAKSRVSALRMLVAKVGKK